jgi:hypothetical protein
MDGAALPRRETNDNQVGGQPAEAQRS